MLKIMVTIALMFLASQNARAQSNHLVKVYNTALFCAVFFIIHDECMTQEQTEPDYKNIARVKAHATIAIKIRMYTNNETGADAKVAASRDMVGPYNAAVRDFYGDNLLCKKRIGAVVDAVNDACTAQIKAYGTLVD